MILEKFVETFPWETDEQRKAFLGLIGYLLDHSTGAPAVMDADLTLVACFFIQKDQEGVRWIMETVGDQISQLQDELKKVKDELHEMQAIRNVDELHQQKLLTS